jgi:hypothetical protein
MIIKCPVCDHENPDNSEFCDRCGSELPEKLPPVATSTPEPITIPNIPIPTIEPDTAVLVVSAATARLIPKRQTSSQSDFILESSNIVGKFDPDMGPVEIDLEEFTGADTISRQHAEIYLESDQWKIKDLGSTNGVFIKRLGQARYSARITTPETLYAGDEISFGKVNFIFQTP